jgi:hypothetical protein
MFQTKKKRDKYNEANLDDKELEGGRRPMQRQKKEKNEDDLVEALKDLDIDKLLKAVDDDSTDYLLGLTTLKIQELNLNVIKQLHLPRAETLEFMKKLEGYKYVDEFEELKYGRFIRYISTTNPDNIPLLKGGFICELKLNDNGAHLVCKNFVHKHFKINMEECFIFQKLSAQESVLISALDHLSKSK